MDENVNCSAKHKGLHECIAAFDLRRMIYDLRFMIYE